MLSFLDSQLSRNLAPRLFFIFHLLLDFLQPKLINVSIIRDSIIIMYDSYLDLTPFAIFFISAM